jgi:predicted esterase
VPIVPDPLPKIPHTPALISNGRLDPLVPVAEPDRLAALLRSTGADVTVKWHQAGHQLVHDDITNARAWLTTIGSSRSSVRGAGAS